MKQMANSLVRNKWKKATNKLQESGIPKLDHFSEANGFYLKLAENDTNLEITPTKAMGEISVSVPRLKMFLENPNNQYGVMVGQANGVGGSEAFNFFETSLGPSELFDGFVTSKSTKFVEVHFAGEFESLGWIVLNRDSTGEDITLIDRKTQTLFTVESDVKQNLITISKFMGATVATFQPKRGLKKRISGEIKWTDWKIKYFPQSSENIPTSSKLTVLVFFILLIQSQGSQITKQSHQWNKY